jgi:hypothetical protein
MLRHIMTLFLCLFVSSATIFANEPGVDQKGWHSLFDGKTLDGWKASEDPQAFKVEDGVIVAGGTRLTHLYYVGPVHAAKFKDFELKAEVKTRPKGNSGIFFHTEYQANRLPAKGFEFQINNTGSDKNFRTGSIYPHAVGRHVCDSKSRSGEHRLFPQFAGETAGVNEAARLSR